MQLVTSLPGIYASSQTLPLYLTEVPSQHWQRNNNQKKGNYSRWAKKSTPFILCTESSDRDLPCFKLSIVIVLENINIDRQTDIGDVQQKDIQTVRQQCAQISLEQCTSFGWGYTRWQHLSTRQAENEPQLLQSDTIHTKTFLPSISKIH